MYSYAIQLINKSLSYNIIVYIHSKWEEWGSTLEMCVYVRVGARKVRVLFQFSGLFWIIFCRNWKAHCIQSTVWCLCRSNFSLFQYFNIDYATHSVWKMLVKMGLQRYNIISFFLVVAVVVSLDRHAVPFYHCLLLLLLFMILMCLWCNSRNQVDLKKATSRYLK